MTREEILAFITAIGERMSAIAQAGATESRSLTEPEQAEWTQLEEWLTGARAIDDRFAAAERAIAAGQATPAVAPRPAPNVNRDRDVWDLSTMRGAPRNEVRARAVTAVESLTDVPDTVRSQIVAAVERHDNRHGDLARHVIATANPEYRDAFREAVLGDGLVSERQRQLLMEARAAIALTTGFSFPVTVDPTILHIGNGSISDIRRLATVKTIVTTTEKVNTLGSVSASYDAESTEVSDDTPADDTVTLTLRKAQAWLEFTIEADQDLASLEADLLEALALGRDDLEATAFATGSGSGANPQGFVTGASNTIDTAGSGAFAIADVYSLYDAVPARYQTNLAWAAAGAIYNKVRQFDTAGGAGLWETIGNGQPSQLLGRPVGTFSAMATAVSAGNDIMVAGDFKAGFRIVERVGMFVEKFSVLDTANNRPNGKRGLYAYWRNGSGVTNANALRLLNVKA